jgi:hypothetical protein
MACELSGRIQDIPVRKLLKWIRHSTRTGVLLLKEGLPDGAVEFLDGEIVSARSGAGFRDIGTILLENKVINIEQLLQAADRQRRAERPAPLGRTLMEMGCAEETDIQKAMRLQVDQVIESLLALNKGCFEFHAARTSRDDITQNVSEVIREADVRRMFTS